MAFVHIVSYMIEFYNMVCNDARAWHSTPKKNDRTLASTLSRSANALFYDLHLTESSEYSQVSHYSNIFISSYSTLWVSGDIRSNLILVSLPSKCALLTSARSFTNPLHYTVIADLADTHNIDVFALTEIWISPNTSSAQLFDAIPRGIPSLTHLVLFLMHILFQSLVVAHHFFSVNLANFSPHVNCYYFQILWIVYTVTIKLPHSILALYIASSIYYEISTFCVFLLASRRLSDSHISSVSTSSHEFLITGDFNIHVDDQHYTPRLY